MVQDREKEVDRKVWLWLVHENYKERGIGHEREKGKNGESVCVCVCV